MGIFEDRCQQDPQGVIADLVKQTGRQGKEINRLLQLTRDQEEKLKAYESSFGALPTPEKKGKTKKTQESP